jgi:hypothetical protein
MLLLLILLVLWFAVMLVFVAVCRMAAHGDGAFPATVDHSMIGCSELQLSVGASTQQPVITPVPTPV